jgi:hypothetical protein
MRKINALFAMFRVFSKGRIYIAMSYQTGGNLESLLLLEMLAMDTRNVSGQSNRQSVLTRIGSILPRFPGVF